MYGTSEKTFKMLNIMLNYYFLLFNEKKMDTKSRSVGETPVDPLFSTITTTILWQRNVYNATINFNTRRVENVYVVSHKFLTYKKSFSPFAIRLHVF